MSGTSQTMTSTNVFRKAPQAKHKTLWIRGCEVTFPHPPYKTQYAMMDKTLEALKKSQNVLLELPTGSGKSLSLLCAAAAWQRSVLKELQEENTQMQKVPLQIVVEQPGNAAEAGLKGSDSKKKEDSKRPRRPPKILFASRTHAQIAQLVRELRKSPYSPRMCILGSREQYCINQDVIKSGNSKGEECKKHVKEGTCGFFQGAQRVAEHKNFADGGSMQVHDIEDLVDFGKKVKGCPYFAARAMVSEADIVFCPYNYLVDPIIRDSMGVDLKGAVVIIDEAHNIEEVCRQAAALEVRQEDLAEACTQWETATLSDDDDAIFNHLLQVVSALKTFVSEQAEKLASIDHNCEVSTFSGADAVEVFASVGVNPDSIKPLNSYLEKALKAADDPKQSEGAGPPPETPAKGLSLVKDLFTKYALLAEHPEDYKMVVQRRTVFAEPPARGGRGAAARGSSRPRLELTLNLWCLNPAVAFAALAASCRSIVLTSGTLSPMVSFASELQTTFHAQLQTDHVIDTAAQVLVGAVPCGPGPAAHKLNGQFKFQDSVAYQDSLGEAVLQLCRTIPHGVLCFFPSYSLLLKVARRWEESGLYGRLEQAKTVVQEPRGTEGFEKAMAAFYAAVRKSEEGQKQGVRGGGGGGGGAGSAMDRWVQRTSVRRGGGLFLAVCRGKVSEGMDFADNNARGVLVVGVPYPNSHDLQVKMKKGYNNQRAARGLLSGDEWYTLQAFRALNQAVGRCIRHIRDFGCIVLLDERYHLKPQLRGNLSKWVRECLVDYPSFDASLLAIRAFFARNAPAPTAPAGHLGSAPHPLPVHVTSKATPPAPGGVSGLARTAATLLDALDPTAAPPTATSAVPNPDSAQPTQLSSSAHLTVRSLPPRAEPRGQEPESGCCQGSGGRVADATPPKGSASAAGSEPAHAPATATAAAAEELPTPPTAAKGRAPSRLECAQCGRALGEVARGGVQAASEVEVRSRFLREAFAGGAGHGAPLRVYSARLDPDAAERGCSGRVKGAVRPETRWEEWESHWSAVDGLVLAKLFCVGCEVALGALVRAAVSSRVHEIDTAWLSVEAVRPCDSTVSLDHRNDDGGLHPGAARQAEEAAHTSVFGGRLSSNHQQGFVPPSRGDEVFVVNDDGAPDLDKARAPTTHDENRNANTAQAHTKAVASMAGGKRRLETSATGSEPNKSSRNQCAEPKDRAGQREKVAFDAKKGRGKAKRSASRSAFAFSSWGAPGEESSDDDFAVNQPRSGKKLSTLKKTSTPTGTS